MPSVVKMAIIRANPVGYVLKIPVRAVAFLYSWAYQPWSLPHRAYDAAFTVFLTLGAVLLIRRRPHDLMVRALLALPVGIWLFLSAYGMDNDLKHRNGIIVAMILVAPFGYFAGAQSREPRTNG